MLSRRDLMKAAAAGAFAPALLAKKASLKVGVTDWNLQQNGKLEAVALAKTLGFDGVQVSMGRVSLMPKRSGRYQGALRAVASTSSATPRTSANRAMRTGMP